VSTRAGTVALVGLPNAGKSSLLNRLIGTKLSIVTPRAQTTRERVVGIDSREGVQMVFVDTPGILRASYLLHHAMAAIVEEAIGDTDVLVLVLDGARGEPHFEPQTLELLRRAEPRLLVVVNKIDQASETSLTATREWARRELGAEAVSVSAATGEGVDSLRARIAGLLPTSEFLYPADELSSQSTRFFTAELIRETIFDLFDDEVPYSTAVRINEFRESGEPVVIRATVYVERASQKAIVIGSGGQAIRALGTAARKKIEDFIDARVFLELWVKVLPRWRKNALELQRLGFPVPKDIG
jgi:GTP-binding protein Era